MLAKVQKKLQRTEGDVQSNHTVVHYTSNDAKKHIIYIKFDGNKIWLCGISIQNHYSS